MRYLVKRDTKEHQRMPFDCLYSPSGWSVVQADSEGWIPHAGNECPLPEDARCEYKMRDGDLSSDSANSLRWSHQGINYDADIVAYRPILTEKVQEPEPHPTEFQKSCFEALQKRFYPEPTASKNELLGRLKAAHAQAQTIPDLEAELREVLGSMGYDLVARSPFVNQCCGNPAQCWEPCGELGKSEDHVAVAEPEPAVETPQEDMTDWRNWREGDLIEVVGAVDSYWQRFYPVGSITTVVTDNDGDFGVRDTGGDVISWGRFGHKRFKPECFRFHSRPAKGEK